MEPVKTINTVILITIEMRFIAGIYETAIEMRFIAGIYETGIFPAFSVAWNAGICSTTHRDPEHCFEIPSGIAHLRVRAVCTPKLAKASSW